MKYKQGDKVRVKPFEELEKVNDFYVGDAMLVLSGTIVTIQYEASIFYTIEEDDYIWTDDMFSGLAGEASENSPPKELNINGLIYILKE